MRVSPKTICPATKCDDLVPVLCTADRRGNIRSCCRAETRNASEVLAKEESVSPLRRAHVPQPLVRHDDVFRFFEADFANGGILEVGSKSHLLFEVGFRLSCHVLPD